MSKAKLPRWECLDKRAAQAMIKWVNSELNKTETIRKNFLNYGETLPENLDAGWSEYMAVKKFEENGDIEPLQQMFPNLAELLLQVRPKRKRGESIKNRVVGPVMKAAIDVKNIRELWKKRFGKVKRSKHDLVKAEQIAADRWKVTVPAVQNKMGKMRFQNPTPPNAD
jgi:hypothetical protein